jgi:AraC-like DNA-binding protein
MTPRAAGAGLEKTRHSAPLRVSFVPPSPDLAPLVATYWIVTWDLRGRPAHREDLLPYPAVNVTFKPGRSRVAGVVSGLFTEWLDGAGTVLGAQFRPGAFRSFLDAPVAAITDRFLDIADVFGVPGDELGRRLLADPEPAAMVAGFERFLRGRPTSTGAGDRGADEAARILAEVTDIAGLTRVDALARHAGVSMRALQRLFHEYVGVSPKWLIRRCRLREATRRIESGEVESWSALAAELGYSDQPHLIRDFTRSVGVPPTRFARTATAAIH